MKRNQNRFDEKRQVLYVIAENPCSGIVKIGYSDDPSSRRAQLQTGNHRPLAIVATFPGSLEDEQRVHSLFAEYRTSIGEWFHRKGRVIDFIKTGQLPMPSNVPTAPAFASPLVPVLSAVVGKNGPRPSNDRPLVPVMSDISRKASR